MAEEQQYEQINLPTAGALPGIPGMHGPGTVIIHSVNGERRVLTPEQWRAEVEAQNVRELQEKTAKEGE